MFSTPPTFRLVDTEQLQSDAWALRDHPDLDVRTLALGANEAAHDVRALSAALEAAQAEVAQLKLDAAFARAADLCAELAPNAETAEWVEAMASDEPPWLPERALEAQAERAAADEGDCDVDDTDYFSYVNAAEDNYRGLVLP
jgi:hypothetical protein